MEGRAGLITRETYGYRLIGISLYPPPHHEVAARFFGFDLDFFDPNAGVVRFDEPAKFIEWFTSVFIPQTQYQRVTGFSVKYFVPTPQTVTITNFP